eukprot:1145844-Pyramimonas_sp.AAC.1
MGRTCREEMLHLIICQMRPVRELSAFPICFSRARGAPKHPRSHVMRVAVAAFHWRMTCARQITALDLR